MSSSKELSLADRYAIVALEKYCGWKQERIAATVKCSQSAVSKILKKWKDDEDVEDRPRTGRKPLIDITNKEDNLIVQQIRKKRNATTQFISNEFRDNFSIAISAETIRRLREQLNFNPVHYRRRQVLSDPSKRKRLYYCIDNVDEDWKNIIFTDESMFIINDDREVIWKRRESPVETKSVSEYPEKVMIWGGVWWDGRTDICIIEGKVNAEVYQQILYDYLVKPHLNDEWEILQDGAKAHTAESTLEFCDSKGIDIRQNPPSSPDLNPIEKVWGWMKHEINKHNIESVNHLIELIKKYWKEIPQSTIRSFIRHNKTVVNDIIAAEGDIILETHRHQPQHFV
jgi:transposase